MAMANGGESWEMEDGDETSREVASELVMCSTCSGFVIKKKRTAIPDPDEEVVEVVTEAKKMRDLMQAVLLHGPLQEKEPARATEEQWRILRRRRRIMMETKRCPACSRSLLEMCPTCSRLLSGKPARPHEHKAAESKEEKKNWREVGSELMAAMEDDAMAVDAGSVKESKGSREEGNGSGSGSKKKAKNKDREGSGSKKIKIWSEDIDEGEMEVGKTKMVTRRLDKKSMEFILKERRPFRPFTDDALVPALKRMIDSEARYEVYCEFHEYLLRKYLIGRYAEYQMEVTDDDE